jgi:ABC-type branched-subunit amino acid transport system substrate-binding protein
MPSDVDPFATDTDNDRTPAEDSERHPFGGRALPVLIGWIRDMGPDFLQMQSVIDFAVAEFNERAVIDREVATVTVEALGAPRGRFANVEAAWHELKDKGCIGILGPHISDNCIEIRPVVDAGRVPTIATGGTAEFAGEYAFGVQWADLPFEGHLIANYCAQQGYRRVAVSYDTAYHSGEYLRHLRAGLRRYGIAECAEERVSQLTTLQARAQAAAAVEAMRRSQPDAVVHLGTGPSGGTIALAIREADWDVPCVMDDAFFIAYHNPMFEGWVGTAAWDETNQVYVSARQRYEKRTGQSIVHPESFAVAYTMTTTMLEGLRLAPIFSTEGLKRGLESVTLLPSAIGGPRTCVGYSRYNHRGVRGADVYVMRRIRDGQSMFEARFDPMIGDTP